MKTAPELNVWWTHDCGPIKEKVQKHKRNFLPFKNTKGRKLVALILSLTLSSNKKKKKISIIDGSFIWVWVDHKSLPKLRVDK